MKLLTLFGIEISFFPFWVKLMPWDIRKGKGWLMVWALQFKKV